MEYQISEHPFSCFAACLASVVNNLTEKVISQANINDYLGLCIPSTSLENMTNFNLKNVNVSENIDDWGINVETKQINQLFDDNNISLTCQYHSSLVFEDWSFEDFLIEETSKGVCPIVGFDYNAYYGIGEVQNAGHVIVCDSIRNGKLVAFDPGPKDAGSKTFDIYDLYVASKKKRGGIWTFRAS